MFQDKDKKLNRLTLKNVLFLVTYTILMVWVILHADDVIALLQTIFDLLRPFIYGIMMAFIFNLPLKYFLRKLPNALGKWKKPVAVLLALLSIGIIIGFIFQIVVPQLIDSIASLANSLPTYVKDVQQALQEAINQNKIPADIMKQIEAYSSQLQEVALDIVKNGLPHVIDFASGFANSVANVVMAIVIAVYLTVSKNKLIQQMKQTVYAFTSDKVNAYVWKVATLTNHTFSNFVAGQLVEAIIIGILCYIGCLIFRFPYAPILSVIIGVTNIIPIFGAIFGTGVSALLVAFVNPIQGVLFLIFGICLQQFESNLIYPRVVGTTVGLSGLWVLFAITIGGGLFGFAGMLLGLPIFSVLYTLFREEVYRKSRLKKEKEEEAVAISDTIVQEETTIHTKEA